MNRPPRGPNALRRPPDASWKPPDCPKTLPSAIRRPADGFLQKMQKLTKNAKCDPDAIYDGFEHHFAAMQTHTTLKVQNGCENQKRVSPMPKMCILPSVRPPDFAQNHGNAAASGVSGGLISKSGRSAWAATRRSRMHPEGPKTQPGGPKWASRLGETHIFKVDAKQ